MVQDISASIEACATDYGDEADAMRAYLLEGQEKALAMNNRGPIVFEEGHLSKDILQAYEENGSMFSLMFSRMMSLTTSRWTSND